MLKYLWRRYGFNPFDHLLRTAQKKGQKRFLVCWNRGLGDIALGLYALIYRIRAYVPDADITFATRLDLAEGFKMLCNVSTIVDPRWKRGSPFELDATLELVGLDRSHFDLILERPDPTRWLMWQLGKLRPQLFWNPAWDLFSDRFGLSKEKTYIGVHIQTQTHYAYEKNWPMEYWREFFQRVIANHKEVILFGFGSPSVFEDKGIHDMRGKTHLLEMLSIIKKYCRFLIVPDSGILSMTYYIDSTFLIDVISLWSDPKQGVLKQNVTSPNPQLKHFPLIADRGDLRSISVDSVMEKLVC